MGILLNEMKKLKENSKRKYTKKKGISGEVWIFDFETLTFFTSTFKKNNDTQIVLWAGRRVGINEDNKDSGEFIEYIPKIQEKFNKRIRQEEVYNTDKFVVGTNGESFLDFVLGLPKNTIIYFHNLSYDGTFIIPILSKCKELEQVHFDLIDNTLSAVGLDEEGNIKRNYWDMFRNGKKIFKIQMKKNGASKNLITIEFRCTSLMLSSSVKKLGDCLAKGGETFMNKPLSKFMEEEEAQGKDFYNVEPYENIETMLKENPGYFYYCLRDVEIVRRSYIYFKDMINELPTVKKVSAEKEEHNEYHTTKGTNNLYKNTNFDIWKSISVAGGMRRMLKEVYIPYYQATNKDFGMLKSYKHNKKLKYGNFSQLPIEVHRYFTEPKNMFPNEVIDNKAKFFRGGFTQLNVNLQSLESAYDVGDCGKWDISSAYPFQMTKPLPFGYLIEEEEFWENYNHLTDEDFYEFLEIPVEKAIPKEIAKYCATLPNLKGMEQNKTKYRYVNQTMEKFTLCVVRQEWDELQNWYHFELSDKYEIKRMYMLAAPFLRDISIELYNEKERYDSLGMEAQKQGAKIAINSVYGSMGIRECFDSLIYINQESAIQLDKQRPREFGYERNGSKATSCDVKHMSRDIKTSKYQGLYIRENKENTSCWNVAAAAVITSLERVYLMETIREVGAQHFGYCDTDSIIFVNMSKEARRIMEEIETRRPLKKIVEFDKQYSGIEIDLGNWEVEYRYIKGFIPHKAKEYIQLIYDYDEKKKCFKDINGNPCKKEQAHIKRKSASAGFTIPKDKSLEDLFYSSLWERKQLTNEDIQVIYKDMKVDIEFCDRIRRGETLIKNGNKITMKCESGDVLLWEDKWTKFGLN